MADENNKDRRDRAAPSRQPDTADKAKTPEPHRLLQDKPEGSRETIERELERQNDKDGGASKAPDHPDRRRPSGNR